MERSRELKDRAVRLVHPCVLLVVSVWHGLLLPNWASLGRLPMSGSGIAAEAMTKLLDKSAGDAVPAHNQCSCPTIGSPPCSCDDISVLVWPLRQSMAQNREFAMTAALAPGIRINHSGVLSSVTSVLCFLLPSFMSPTVRNLRRCLSPCGFSCG
jgi:hypothetical protein